MIKEVISIEKFGDNDRFLYEEEGRSILIIRLESEFTAIENTCSHAGWSLEDGEINDGIIECDLHGAQFCVRTGKACRLPASNPIKTYPIYEKDGSVFIELDDSKDIEHGS